MAAAGPCVGLHVSPAVISAAACVTAQGLHVSSDLDVCSDVRREACQSTSGANPFAASSYSSMRPERMS